MREYCIDSERIVIIPDAWQHYNRITPDYSIFDLTPSIRKKKYYYAMGSMGAHKNFRWIIENARKYPKYMFVVSGRIDKKLYAGIEDFTDYKNIIYVGYVSDEIAKALMMECKAFVFPSLYEGFGIPPMEALSCNTNVIISDIPVHREIYGDSVSYLDPYNSELDLENICFKHEDIDKVLDRFSWVSSAKNLYELMV